MTCLICQRGWQHALSPLLVMHFCCMLLRVPFWWQYIFSDCLGRVSTTVWMCEIFNQKSQTALKRTGNKTFPQICCIFLKVWAADKRHALAKPCTVYDKHMSKLTQNIFALAATVKNTLRNKIKVGLELNFLCDGPFYHYWFSHIMPAFHQQPNGLECAGKILTFQ